MGLPARRGFALILGDRRYYPIAGASGGVIAHGLTWAITHATEPRWRSLSHENCVDQFMNP
jgi:hypothetical protein